MVTNSYVDLLPYRQVSEHDILQMFSLDNTGVGGRFVQFLTGNNSPLDSDGTWSDATPGYDYAGVTNVRYENQRKVTYAGSGAFKHQVVGLLLNGTVEYDENGQKVLFNKQVQVEKQIVVSGMTVPIATDGVFTLRANAYSGTPLPGYIGYISNGGAGKLQFAAPSAANAPYAVCKVLSTTGSAFGGYVQIKLTLK